MIKRLRLHNFKAFEDTGDIEIKPITVLAGPNSSGKTSLLQSLLLLRQTLESASPDVGLNLNGRFVQFSAFNDLTFGKPRLRRCEVGYKIRTEIPMPAKEIPRHFPGVAVPEGEKSLLLQSDIELSFRSKEVSEGKSRVILNRFDMTCYLQGLPGPRLTINFRKRRHQASLQRVKLREAYEGRRINDTALNHFVPVFFMFEAGPEDESAPPPLRVPEIFWNPLLNLIDELRSSMEYLGPLREEPQRAYLHSGSPFPEIGQRGEFAAQVLWLEKDTVVHYKPSMHEEADTVPLLTAVGDAFQRLGITQPINVRSGMSIVYQILFGLKGWKQRKHVSIADVGFGVSQLLPIVVMGLRAPEGSLLLFEQPEIHLHPQVQASLADFFLTLGESKKRLLIETHSDYFINRLRRRIAEDPTDELGERVSILFVRPPEDGKGAVIEPMRVDRYGVIENWPADFLPESADEAERIIRAGLKKRQGK